jgi:uncharacterized protein (TIGR03067 family)
MRRCGLAGLALLLGGGVLADEKKTDKAEAVKEEWKRLNGTWKWVRAVVDGREVAAPKPWHKETLTLKDGKYTCREGKMVEEEGTAKLDPTTTPKSMDISAGTGPDKGKTILALYEVRGDTLRVCLAPPGKPRPKAFESKEGSGHVVVTHKRVKTED